MGKGCGLAAVEAAGARGVPFCSCAGAERAVCRVFWPRLCGCVGTVGRGSGGAAAIARLLW